MSKIQIYLTSNKKDAEFTRVNDRQIPLKVAKKSAKNLIYVMADNKHVFKTFLSSLVKSLINMAFV